jgi:serine protease Do
MKTALSWVRWQVAAIAVALLCASLSVHAGGLPDFTELVEDYSPVVVNISTTQKRTAPFQLRRDFRIPDLPEDSPFHDFFRRFLEEGEEGGREYNAASLGSGFIISEDGYILTNHHVVAGADEIIVRLSDRREFEAEVIGSDKASDTALLKIEAQDLPVVKVGQSSELKVGEWVLAIGSPFGFDHSVTAGIVSAKGRSLPRENYVPFIQTDVAINPGNSGGPLFNLDGEVVGVNSQIYSRTGGFMGLSFAIPIEVAMNVADQLRTKGRVSRGWLGVLIQDVTRDLADSFGMDHPHGALIAKVLPDSPAEAAGLQTGDIVLKFNGKKIANSTMLPPLVGASVVGENSVLTVLRKGKQRQIRVEIGELPEEDELALRDAPDRKKRVRLLGLTVADLSEEQREKLNLRNDSGGVLVKNVKQGPARAAGIRSGDVIQMINNSPVNSVSELKELVDSLPKGKSVAVLVLRKTGPLFLALQVPEE